MSNKNKLTSKPVKSKAMPSLQTRLMDLTTDVDLQCETKEKGNTNKILANFCQKKCHGANNWKAFIGSSLNQKDSATSKQSTYKSNKSNSVPESFFRSSSFSNRTLQRKNVNNSFEYVEVNPGHKKTEINNVVLTKQISMDCEMVGVEMGVDNNMLARISLVNALGDCVYDKFVQPTEPVLDYRTHVSGVRAEDLKTADEFKVVQEEVAAILKGRVLVGHGLKNDLKVLHLSHPKQSVRDTSKYKRFREGRTPSLKKLAKKYLGVTIQEGEHSSVQDALAAMQLYRMFKKEWEGTLKTSSLKLKEKAPNTSFNSFKM